MPVLGGVAIGLARMSVHELTGCVALVLALSPALAPFLVAAAASELERAQVMRAALRNSVAADWLLLLPCVLVGTVLGRWIASACHSRPAGVGEKGRAQDRSIWRLPEGAASHPRGTKADERIS
jgi:hypothetical protein